MRTAAAATVVLLALFACGGARPAAEQAAAAAPAGFDSARAWEHLRRQVAFGPRPAGSTALADCRRYLIDQLEAIGIEAREQPFDVDTPLGRIKMANVVATIPGARPERIAIASHYDTKLYREFRFVGADDGGSSTAVLLELARVLRTRRNALMIELLFFDGEEATRPDWAGSDNTYGSRHYVGAAQKAGTLNSLKALILLDMVGDRQLNFRRESRSTPWLTDALWSAASKLGYGAYFLREEGPIEDDHVPFLQAGVPSVDLIDLEYAAWHSAGDTLDAVSARSLQITGDVVLEALPQIEKRLSSAR